MPCLHTAEFDRWVNPSEDELKVQSCVLRTRQSRFLLCRIFFGVLLRGEADLPLRFPGRGSRQVAQRRHQRLVHHLHKPAARFQASGLSA